MFDAISLAIFAFTMALVNNSLGGGYGTLSSPLLIVFGYPAKVTVPAILTSEASSEFFSSLWHAKFKNVNYRVFALTTLGGNIRHRCSRLHHRGLSHINGSQALHRGDSCRHGNLRHHEVFLILHQAFTREAQDQCIADRRFRRDLWLQQVLHRWRLRASQHVRVPTSGTCTSSSCGHDNPY